MTLAMGIMACGGPRAATHDTLAAPATAPRFVDGPAGKIRVDDGGPKNQLVPVIFVHGLAGHFSMWYAQLSHVRATRRAIALDLRGHGESPPPSTGAYGVTDNAADVIAVADALGVKRFVIVGHSYGGAVIGAVAGAHPDRVAGVLFVDPAGDLSNASEADRAEMDQGLSPATYAKFTRDWYTEILGDARPAVKDEVLAQLARTPREVFQATFDGMVAYHAREGFAPYAGPRLSVIAARNADNPSALHNTVPNIPTRAIAGVSHWLMMDEPDDFDAILDEFLRGVDR